MLHVEDHHLGSTPGLATRLDDTGKSIETLHERQRTRGAPTTRQDGVFFAEGRQVRPRAGPKLEQHALCLGQIQDGFQRVFYRHNKTGRALGLGFILDLGNVIMLRIVEPPVAAGFLHADVEPDGRIERGLLVEHQVGQFGAKVLAVRHRGKVAVF